jgi:hypothetical protein
MGTRVRDLSEERGILLRIQEVVAVTAWSWCRGVVVLRAESEGVCECLPASPPPLQDGTHDAQASGTATSEASMKQLLVEVISGCRLSLHVQEDLQPRILVCSVC